MTDTITYRVESKSKSGEHGVIHGSNLELMLHIVQHSGHEATKKVKITNNKEEVLWKR